MKKYIYGRRDKLSNLVGGQGYIRFSDIIYYSIMENDSMRDDETKKEFVLDKHSFKFELDGYPLNPEHMTENPVMIVDSPRAFCLCLSNTVNSPELFRHFKADVCVEIDVEKLVSLLTIAFSNFKGAQIKHRVVNYYPPIMKGPGPEIENVLFYKRDSFFIEDEYRVAIILPRGKVTGPNALDIELYSDIKGQEQHLYIKGGRDEYRCEVHYLD